MRTVYQVLRKANPNDLNIVMTVTKGDHFGEKAFFSNGIKQWESSADGFFSKHIEICSGIDENQMLDLDGNEVFCDIVGHEKTLVICGGGHVSMPVIKIGRMLEFNVVVLEDRPEFAQHAKDAGANMVICEAFETGLDQISGDRDTYFVIVTRGHRYDKACLSKIAEKEHGYIGLIGSRGRVQILKEELADAGTDVQVLEQVHNPIGLDIGAETPEEIAVSILAEIIAEKSKRNRGFGYSKKLLRAIMDTEDPTEQMVLATIIKRKGSAPREVGTKMLMKKDGSFVGTLGGGYVEAEVLKMGAEMLQDPKEKSFVHTVDMSGAAAEEEGMVCGGTVAILFELI